MTSRIFTFVLGGMVVRAVPRLMLEGRGRGFSRSRKGKPPLKLVSLIQKLGVRAVNKSRREILDSLVISYGKSAGRVIRSSSHKGYHFSASKGSVYVSLGGAAFDRLVKLGKIDWKGVPT